jgi:hypothetical protein
MMITSTRYENSCLKIKLILTNGCIPSTHTCGETKNLEDMQNKKQQALGVS